MDGCKAPFAGDVVSDHFILAEALKASRS
jgi:hypothetical protein